MFTHIELTRLQEIATVGRASCPASIGGRDQEIAPTEDAQWREIYRGRYQEFLSHSLFAHLISLDCYYKPNNVSPICKILSCNDYRCDSPGIPSDLG